MKRAGDGFRSCARTRQANATADRVPESTGPLRTVHPSVYEERLAGHVAIALHGGDPVGDLLGSAEAPHRDRAARADCDAAGFGAA